MIQPPGLGGSPVCRPAFARDEERLLDHLFGEVDVAEETDQGGDDPTGLLTEDPFEVAGVGDRPGTVRSYSAWNGRTSTGPMQAADALAAQRERGVEVGGLDDPEAAEVLLRLGERAVGDDGLAVLRVHDGCDLGRFEAAAEHPLAGGLDLGVERVDLLGTPSASGRAAGGGASGLW